MAYTFEQLFAADPSNPSNVAQNASITIFAPGDATMTPIPITDPDGTPLPNPFTVNANGFGPAFAHATLDRVAWAGGGFTGYMTSYEGLKNEAVDARTAAETAAADAAAAAQADLETRIAAGNFKGDPGMPGANGTNGVNGANVLPTQQAIEQALINDGPAKTALEGKIVDEKDYPSDTIGAALPFLTKAIAEYNDATAPTLRVIGLGSSVGVGATLPDPATQAPSAYFTTQVGAALNRLGNLSFALTNGSVNGSIITEGQATHYAAAKTTAGGAPNIVVLAYGMNDGMPAQYHAGQTYPWVYTRGQQIIEAAKADGSDVVILTSPHPHTQRTPWSFGLTPIYPNATVTPSATLSGSVKNVKAPHGATVPASYRHLRVNESLRRLGADMGVPVLDAERYWFDAVAEHGEDALFNAGEYAHPNLLGHQESYWKAIDAFVRSLSRPVVQGGAPRPSVTAAAPVTTVKVDNASRTNTTTLTADAQLAFTAGANEIWKVDLRVFYTGTAGDLRIGLALPTGATGRAGVHAPATDATTFTSDNATSRSVALPDTYGLPVGGNGADAMATYSAIVRTAGTGGTITAQFCQDTSSGTATTIYANSTMTATKVA